MKKLLLLLPLIAITSIAFSQDNIVLKNGDEIVAKIFEVGESNIKYKKFNNQDGPIYTKSKDEIFYIKYSNGDKEMFSKNVNNKSSKNLVDKKHLYFQVGVNQFIPSTASITETSFGYVAKTGFLSKVSYQVYINENLSYIPSAAFHFISFEGNSTFSNNISVEDQNDPFLIFGGTNTTNYNRSLLSVGNEIEYNIKNRFYASLGLSLDWLLRANNPHNNLSFGDMIDSQQGFTYLNIEGDSRKDLGYYSSFILNLKYILNQEGKIRYFIFSDSKIPFYYSNQPKEESIGGIPMQRRQFTA